MHPRAWNYVADKLAREDLIHGERVVEFGGATITGGYDLRRLLPWVTWTSVDVEDHEGVDAVGDAATWGEPYTADVVVATELLEHAHDAAAVVANARRILVPGGLFLATMAGPTRTAHGARGGPEPEPGEYYRNVDPWDLAAWLYEGGFSEIELHLTGDHLDLRCAARAS